MEDLIFDELVDVLYWVDFVCIFVEFGYIRWKLVNFIGILWVKLIIFFFL